MAANAGIGGNASTGTGRGFETRDGLWLGAGARDGGVALASSLFPDDTGSVSSTVHSTRTGSGGCRYKGTIVTAPAASKCRHAETKKAFSSGAIIPPAPRTRVISCNDAVIIGHVETGLAEELSTAFNLPAIHDAFAATGTLNAT